MSLEGHRLDKKWLLPVTSKTTGWDEIAKDHLVFANANCDRLLTAIKEGQNARPAGN